MNTSRSMSLFLNVGHALDHLLMLIFPTVVLAMGAELGRGYADLLPLSLGGFIAFGAFSIPAGWLADHWSRQGMMRVFFFGIGTASVLTLNKFGYQLLKGILRDKVGRCDLGENPEGDRHESVRRALEKLKADRPDVQKLLPWNLARRVYLDLISTLATRRGDHDLAGRAGSARTSEPLRS